jgi:hypothetical protein
MSSENKAPKVPIARVKRIIKQDDDICGVVSSSAVYSIAAATVSVKRDGEG